MNSGKVTPKGVLKTPFIYLADEYRGESGYAAGPLITRKGSA
jgi:hypothetical protein